MLIFGFGLFGGLYGQNLPYKFKNSYDDIKHRNIEKSHRTTGPWSDLRPVILSKFWSRYDLQNFREQKFLGDDQSELIKGTVQLCIHLNLVLLVVVRESVF